MANTTGNASDAQTLVYLRVISPETGRPALVGVPGQVVAANLLQRDDIIAVTLVGQELEVRLDESAILLQEENTSLGKAPYAVLSLNASWSNVRTAADHVRQTHLAPARA